MKNNIMRNIQIEKVTLNMGVGEAGDKLKKAKKLLQMISKEKPIETRTMKRIPTWKVRPKLAIGCKVTLRSKKADTILRRLLKAKEGLSEKNLDSSGNLSFGIPEYIDIPDAEYDPELGIVGFEASVTFERPGYRIKRRLNHKKIPKSHRITKEEVMSFLKENYELRDEE
jgi:large subunit ribosomal protein L5